MGIKLSDLIDVTTLGATDIMHLRTIGAIDKKITGENLREDLKKDRGMVASFITKVREGWIWCNGATISDIANPEYEALIVDLKAEAGADAGHPYYHADADKAKLPNIKGAAVRGIDTAANRDKDGVRKSGGYQGDGNDPHTHVITHNHNYYIVGVGAGEAGEGLNRDTANGVTSKRVISSGGIIAHSGNSGNNGVGEGTVKNVALYYLIRY